METLCKPGPGMHRCGILEQKSLWAISLHCQPELTLAVLLMLMTTLPPQPPDAPEAHRESALEAQGIHHEHNAGPHPTHADSEPKSAGLTQAENLPQGDASHAFTRLSPRSPLCLRRPITKHTEALP